MLFRPAPQGRGPVVQYSSARNQYFSVLLLYQLGAVYALFCRASSALIFNQKTLLEQLLDSTAVSSAKNAELHAATLVAGDGCV